MRICIVVEGCYPYSVGGVSSWVHSIIQSFPEYEFVLQTIVSNRSLRGKFMYEIPDNVSEIHEMYLEDVDWGRHRKRMNHKEFNALRSLLLDQNIDWETLIDFWQQKGRSLNKVLMGKDFLLAVQNFYEVHYSQVVFTDFLWMMRSIYLPLFRTMKTKLPKADLYHCLCTGYAGMLGGIGKYLYGSPLIISEHGIYTREREEDLVKAKWVQGLYKNVWINQFKKMSRFAYVQADLVTSLYEQARILQIELDCPEQKTLVTPNGIAVEKFQNLPGKQEEDKGYIHVGSVLRISAIKDVKTMLQAFSIALEREPNLKLWVMGPWEEDDEYAQQCFDLTKDLGLENVVFTGRIDVREYLGRMDMTILTSISEGQPMTILESFAAHKPVIATNVGNCQGLVMGEDDGIGAAGIITHIMNQEEIAQAILYLAHHPEIRQQMGENGYQRVVSRYRIDQMLDTYRHIYHDFEEQSRNKQ